VCAARCCADCVELVGGILTPRAVCRSCIETNRRPADLRVFLRGAAVCAAAIAGLAAAVLLLMR
jgi:hypothetical protein